MIDFQTTLYVQTNYRPSPGSFGKPKLVETELNNQYIVNAWFDCRELWHTHLYNLNLFFYTHKANTGIDIAAFISKIEKILNLRNKTKFGPTQRKTIMWIEPSKWWTKPPMRRSLFTILLRSAANYSIEKDNFEESLYSNAYALKTKPAIQWFLQGNTVYSGKKIGWYKQFEDILKFNDSFLLAKLLIPENN
jgi:hypothetical protein